jgi:hypothetical protein
MILGDFKMYNASVWGYIATWITGLATISLFVIGFIQIRNERLARLKREKESELHQTRSQAELISSWIADEIDFKVWIAVCNNSSLPIYQVIIYLESIFDEGDTYGDKLSNPICVSVVPPGIGYVTAEASYHGMNTRAGIEIGFKDTFGKNWVRRSNGSLQQITESTVRHFDIAMPAGWIGLIPSSEFEKIKAKK